jgi:hypothetical protein
LAPHLLRPWMESPHRIWLASTEFIDPAAPGEMVGANMAFGRHTLTKVPAFDQELGPGALGQGADSLFSWQLARAGFRIGSALNVAADHHFDPDRLTRKSFLASAAKRGRTLAYQRWHWCHEGLAHPTRRLAVRLMRLARGRLAERSTGRSAEGISVWEMYLMEEIHFLRRWRTERTRPRNYERRGLVRRSD